MVVPAVEPSESQCVVWLLGRGKGAMLEKLTAVTLALATLVVVSTAFAAVAPGPIEAPTISCER